MGSPPHCPRPFPAGRCQPAQLGTGALLGGRAASSLTPHTPNLRAADFSGNGDKLGTRRRRTRDSHSESCPEEAKPCSPPRPSSWGPPRHSPWGQNPQFHPVLPHGGFSSQDAAPVPCALPATRCFPSASLRERERGEGTCASQRTQIFHIEPVSRGCGSLKQGKSVSSATFVLESAAQEMTARC